MDLLTLTLTQLFARQAQINADHERLLDARNGAPFGSFDWELHNAAMTGTMQDLADIAAEITRRITEMREEAAAGNDLTRVPMVCTACRKPVTSFSNAANGWLHEDATDARTCPRAGRPVTVMVAAGNENVARNA